MSDMLDVANAIERRILKLETENERLRTALKLDRHYLAAIKRRLETFYELMPKSPNIRERISDEIDWLNEKLRTQE